MRDHAVEIVPSEHGTVLSFAPTFNAAAAFIDRHLAEGRSDKVAVLHEQTSVTYGELARHVNRAGRALLSLGLESGDRVLMMVRDCPEFLYLFWGAIKAGLVPVPINTLLRARDYQFMIEDSGAVAVFYSPALAAEVEPALDAADPCPRCRVPVEGEGLSLGSLMAGVDDDLAPAAVGPDDDCFWLYSSGSTGTPKGAVHTQRAMVVTSQRYGVETLGLREDDVSHSAAKLFFAYGLGNGMTFPLWVGATTVLRSGKPTPDAVFELIERHRPSVYYGVPTLYAAMLRDLSARPRDTSSLRLCVSAGEALPADLFHRWKAGTGTVILDGIGSTEILHIFISNSEDDIQPGATGRPVSGYEARVVDDVGAPVTQGEPGRLLIRGGSICDRYWNNPEKTAATIQDGWIDTGDTYRQDADSYFVYCGRGNDMLKVGGIWCSPFEIEAHLIAHPAVLEAAVVGRKNDEDLVKPEAWVVLEDAGQASDELAQALLTHCKGGLAPYKYPRWIHFVAELPKTATGKIRRFMLRS
jgi:benzoate-CoA ligase family protein